MSTEHGRQWWSTIPAVLRRYRSWQTFLGCNLATLAVAACLGENHRTNKFRKWSELITMILNICKSDSLPGLYPSNASTSSGKVTAAYQRWCNTMYHQQSMELHNIELLCTAVQCLHRAAVSGGCGYVCSSSNINLRLEPWVARLRGAACFGLLVPVIFVRKVWIVYRM